MVAWKDWALCAVWVADWGHRRSRCRRPWGGGGQCLPGGGFDYVELGVAIDDLDAFEVALVERALTTLRSI